MSGQVELVVFEIDGARYGADLTQVDHLERSRPEDLAAAPLGKLRTGERALVIRSADGLPRRLAVDALLGVESVNVNMLRRLPAVASSGALPIGAWLDGETTVLLVDLQRIAPVVEAKGTET
ncbi:MAG: Frizzy aggregation protein FrzB [Myxococcaceae bacterium]|nr:Frizzy aggregation protein FrzB [Myxococcaceae bacterium]